MDNQEVPETTEAENSSPEPENNSLLGDNSATLNEGEWLYGENMKGVGDVPEWFQAEKYSSVSDQAKAYVDLQKKFGSFTGTPKDGYQLPEGLSEEDALVQEVMKFGESSNLNQEGFDSLMELAMTQAQVTQEVSMENEVAKLGDNAKERINRVDGYLRNNLEADKYNEVAQMLTTADSIALAETLMTLNVQPTLPIGDAVTSDGHTIDDLTEMQLQKDADGNFLMNTSETHRKKVARIRSELEKKYG